MKYKLPIKEFAEKVSSMSKEDFVKKLPYPFLIEFECQPEYKKIDAFETVDDTRRLRDISNLQFTISAGCNVIYMGKNPDSNHPRLLTIGRSEGIDVHIDHMTVSKRHAHLQICPEFKRYLIVDDNSTNGTYVNGKKLKSKSPFALYTMDFISFGEDIYFQFFPSADMYDKLQEIGLVQ